MRTEPKEVLRVLGECLPDIGPSIQAEFFHDHDHGRDLYHIHLRFGSFERCTVVPAILILTYRDQVWRYAVHKFLAAVLVERPDTQFIVYDSKEGMAQA
jgi:hypothetical protein